MMKRPVFLLVLLLLANLACSLGGLANSGPTADPNLLFQDDFSNTASGWDSFRDDQGITDYENGSYRILVNQAHYNYWSNPGLGDKFPADVRIEVEATRSAGPEQNSFGVICRHTIQNDLSNFYYFLVTSDGYVGIFRVQESEEQLLSGSGETLLTSSAINSGTAMNRIRAECVGKTLTLFVNGTQVDSVTDETFSSGDVGLIAGTYDEAGADILFDNFKVTKP